MKSFRDEARSVLSKNTAKHLLARNAGQEEILRKKSLRFDKEKCMEERSFQKKKDLILQRHLNMCELQSSASLCRFSGFDSTKMGKKAQICLLPNNNIKFVPPKPRSERPSSSRSQDTVSSNGSIKNAAYKGTAIDTRPPISLPPINTQDRLARKKNSATEKPSKTFDTDNGFCRISWGTAAECQDLTKCRYLRTWRYKEDGGD